MFGTILLATFTGAELTQAKSLNERGNGQSYCSTNNKCSQAKQLQQASSYCISALAIPQATKTRTVTKCATTTSTILSYTSTITIPASTVTSTICSCATPTAELKKRAQHQQKVSKPSCFSGLSDAKAISSACGCLSINTRGATTAFTTTTKTKTVKTTIKTDTTVNATPTTEYALAVPTLVVANEVGNIWSYQGACEKSQQSGCGDVGFSPDTNWQELLLALNSKNQLQTLTNDGYVGEVSPRATPEENGTYEVVYDVPIVDGYYTPLTCSISQAPDGTCPLACQVRAGDVNQGPTDQETPWYLGPPGAVSANTFKTYAISRGSGSSRGGCGSGRKYRGRI